MGLYDSWLHKAQIELDTTSGGVEINTTQVNFPVLIRITSSEINFDQVDTNGEDIRFTNILEDTDLKFEIERWDNGSSLGEIWVRVPFVFHQAKTSIVMHWGKTGQTTQSSPGDTFVIADGFDAVWHLDENGNNTTDGYKDATNNNSHATGANIDTGDDVAVQIGLGHDIDGLNEYFNVPAGSAEIDLANKSFSLSVWAKRNTTGNDNFIMSQGTFATRDGLHFGFRDNDKFTFAFFADDLDTAADTTTALNHWFATYNSSDKKQIIYKNGVEVASRTAGGDFTGTGAFDIGRREMGGDAYWPGQVDEAQVHNVLRSPDFIKLCFQNQQTTDTLVTFTSITKKRKRTALAGGFQ